MFSKKKNVKIDRKSGERTPIVNRVPLTAILIITYVRVGIFAYIIIGINRYRIFPRNFGNHICTRTQSRRSYTNIFDIYRNVYIHCVVSVIIYIFQGTFSIYVYIYIYIIRSSRRRRIETRPNETRFSFRVFYV